MTSLEPLSQDAYEPGISIGIFLLDWQTYKADPGINQSALKQIFRSMAHWEESKKKPEKKTPDLILGGLFHLAILEPQLFGESKSHWTCPPTYPANKMSGAVKRGECNVGDPIPWNNNATFCKTWVEEREEGNLPVISQETYEQIIGMRAAVMADALARDFIDNAHTEVAMFCIDPVTGMRLKCRLDLLAESPQFIYIGDFKKIGDAQEESAARTFAKFGYYIQGAFSKAIMRILLDTFGLPQRPVRFINGCVEDEAPHAVLWWELDDDSLAKGKENYIKALQRYAEASKTKTVPGYPNAGQINKLRLPGWVLRNQDED